MRVINLTQHRATQDQIDAGVFEPANKEDVHDLLTFDELPTRDEMIARARRLAEIAKWSRAEAAMIGGAPFFMAPLEWALGWMEVKAVYAFSRRESVEMPGPGGEVRKTAVFRHVGFVPAVSEKTVVMDSGYGCAHDVVMV